MGMPILHRSFAATTVMCRLVFRPRDQIHTGTKQNSQRKGLPFFVASLSALHREEGKIVFWIITAILYASHL